MVEVFKTNIVDKQSANKVLIELERQLPNALINFDLEDCDNILRIEHSRIHVDAVVFVLNNSGFYCEPLQ